MGSIIQRRWSFTGEVFAGGRGIPFARVAAVPFTTFFIGVPAAMALLTFVWLVFVPREAAWRRRSVVGLSILVFGIVYFAVELLARLRLPDPFIVTLFERNFSF